MKPATKHFLAVPHPSRIVICERPSWYIVQQDVQIIGICVFFISVSRLDGFYKSISSFLEAGMTPSIWVCVSNMDRGIALLI